MLDKNQKRRIIITIVILLFIIVGSLSSCAIAKKEKSTITTKREFKDKTKDSSSVIKVSEPIKDNITINVPKTDNKEVMDMFVSLMNQMNTSKSSGSNSYKSTFDKETMQWMIEFAVAQTENKSIEVKEESNEEKSFDSQVDEYVKKIVIPWWMYLIGIILCWPFIKSTLFLIFQQLQTFKINVFK